MTRFDPGCVKTRRKRPYDVAEREFSRFFSVPRAAGCAKHWWLMRELREILPPTIFFFIGFNLIVFTAAHRRPPAAIFVSGLIPLTAAAHSAVPWTKRSSQRGALVVA